MPKAIRTKYLMETAQKQKKLVYMMIQEFSSYSPPAKFTNPVDGSIDEENPKFTFVAMSGRTKAAGGFQF